MNSSIYMGTVWHKRWQPRAHPLSYRVFYLLLDLDEGIELDGVSRLFGWNRSALFAFHDADHGLGGSAVGHATFKAHLASCLEQQGYGSGPWRFRVLCMPRTLGYVFNPITVVYCLHEEDQLAAMLYEVNNTFGERISYLVPITGRNGPYRHRCEKSMFVSPFFELKGDYAFAITEPAERLTLRIDYQSDGQRRLGAVFSGRRQAFDAGNLRAAALRFPFAALGVTTAIHYEALKLWLKGIKPHTHQPAPRTLSTGA